MTTTFRYIFLSFGFPTPVAVSLSRRFRNPSCYFSSTYPFPSTSLTILSLAENSFYNLNRFAWKTRLFSCVPSSGFVTLLSTFFPPQQKLKKKPGTFYTINVYLTSLNFKQMTQTLILQLNMLGQYVSFLN